MELIARFLAVFAVLGCVLLLSWLLRRAGMVTVRSAKGSKWVQVVERTACGPHLSIQVIRIAERHVVIAVHSSGITVLERIDAARSLDPRHDAIAMNGFAGGSS